MYLVDIPTSKRPNRASMMLLKATEKRKAFVRCRWALEQKFFTGANAGADTRNDATLEAHKNFEAIKIFM